MLLAGFATLTVVTKVTMDNFFPARSRLARKLLMATAPAASIAIAPATLNAQKLEWTPVTSRPTPAKQLTPSGR
jgi:hypothetical protein